MKKLRLSVIGMASAVAGFGLQACFAPQPPPECTVIGTQGAYGITPYYAVLTETSKTGTCPSLDHLQIGVQNYRAPNSLDSFVAVRPSRLTDMWNGEIFSGFSDPSNDCANEEDCDICVVGLEDGGLGLGAEPTAPIVDLADGGSEAQFADGGSIPVDPANECMLVEEPIYRLDPADQDGKGLIGQGKFATILPTADGVCSLGAFTPAKQDFQAEPLQLEDGGTDSLPALSSSYEWTDFQIINTSRVPATIFTAKLKLTEGSCVANYDVEAFWPIVGCAEDADCNPTADADAGQVFGSGINPLFEPKCDTALGVCKPSVDIKTLR